MSATTLQKRCSPLTNSVGPDKINRSITLTLQAEALLSQMAAETGESVNEFCRQALAMRAAAMKTKTAVAFRSALNVNRRIVCTITCLAMVLFIEARTWWLSFADDEFRGTRKSCARKVRRGREDVWQFEVEGA